MKKVVLCFLLSVFTLSISAQSVSKNEIGFSLKGFDAFGLTAKFESQPNRYWRIGALSIIGNSDKTSTRDTISLKEGDFGMEFGFGKEIRKPITGEFFIYFGAGALVGFNVSNREVEINGELFETFDNSKRRSVHAGIGVPIGFNYILKDVVNFSIEFEPTIGYRYTNLSTQNQDMNQPVDIITHSLFTRVNTESLKISIAYRFNKKKSK